MIAKIFSDGDSQVLQLPKEFSFPSVSEVYVRKLGNKIILEPVVRSWISLLKGIALLPDDFEFSRDVDPDIDNI